DVFVTTRSDFRAQLRRCQRLLEAPGLRELRLHGLGLAVPRTINLALQLQAAAAPGRLRLHVTTASVPLPPDGDRRRGADGAAARHHSAIHIRVRRLGAA
ncbi:ribonuclease P protein subunit p20, partial [Nothoprocta perdicaria]|uniref:ribonuclease P protein subunit p20 n=1 Tax=Nothoprocta perdicaria TaxID=30464 RepID=UPI000E1BF15D